MFSRQSLRGKFGLLKFVKRGGGGLVYNSSSVSIVTIFVFRLFTIVGENFARDAKGCTFGSLFVIGSRSTSGRGRVRFFRDIYGFVSRLFKVNYGTNFSGFGIGLKGKFLRDSFTGQNFTDDRGCGPTVRFPSSCYTFTCSNFEITLGFNTVLGLTIAFM